MALKQPQKVAPDQADRDAAIAERERNVLVDAGAGTGKTSILVSRLVNMLAPKGQGKSVPFSRIAAITFTRKAAGELRLRIRERLLEELSESHPGTVRDDQLRDALAGLDTAYVGTIHSFADRLLRLYSMEAQLSPSYEIAEDDSALIRETFEILIHAAENGTLAAELAGSSAVQDAEQMTQTVLDALGAGINPESQEREWGTSYGLHGLVAGFIRRRDVPPAAMPPAEFDAGAFRAAVDKFLRLSADIRRTSAGSEWILRTAEALSELRSCDDPVQLLHGLMRQFERAPREVSKRDTFANDNAAWQAWKLFDKREGGPSLRDQLRAPLDRWMATRLVRLFPAVVALYEKVKARRRQLDQLDLLIKLRGLLAGNNKVRAEYQQMFDHILMDEFQDTDPLQAEIILYLCEKEPLADCWQDVVLADGKLTLVGDPKQSIYRFRRADVAMYDRVRGVVAKSHHLEAKLSANFRSVPPLIGWLNDRFARILGSPANGRPFDPATGKVFQQPLAAGREGTKDCAVAVLPFDFTAGKEHGADEYRQLEGQVLARYLRSLVESSTIQIVDPLDGSRRRVRYGDVAVLAVSTWRLSFLFPWLDREDIPYASRGGRLFLEDPLHRQFILGLRAIADPSDGVAEAALLRPPFFAVDLLDLLRERSDKPENGAKAGPEVQRAREARELVRELRRRRFERSVGSTARDLLDRTAIARAVALGPNGAQRITRLREICLVLEQTAAAEGLDYDGATARLRKWIDDPVELDPPYPVDGEAVQVMTIHQAKGLEFPVVILWDGKGQWNTRPESFAWRVERDGRGWMVDLDQLKWEEPPGLGIRELERVYLNAERQRVIYVAATRARDLLVIPKAGEVPPERFVCGDLLAQAPESLVCTMDLYSPGAEPEWARGAGPHLQAARGDIGEIEKRVADQWAQASQEAARPRFTPWSVTAERHSTTAGSEEEPGLAPEEPGGRFGAVFGSVVHFSIGSALRNGGVYTQGTASRIAKRRGLPDHVASQAEADVARALEALRSIGLARRPGIDLQLEYPIAGAWDGGKLITGYIDLIAVADGLVQLIDFKTDSPPEGLVGLAYPRYLVQIRTYARLIEAAGILQGRRVRCGLLFTANGGIHWAEE